MHLGGPGRGSALPHDADPWQLSVTAGLERAAAEFVGSRELVDRQWLAVRQVGE